MNILIGYATYSSGTLTAASVVEEELKRHGFVVHKKDIREVTESDLHESDLVILGSPSWWNRNMDGMPHEFMLAFFDKIRGKTFPAKSFAVFGLGDTAYTKFCGAVNHMEEFVQSVQGKLITQSLRIDGFYFNQSQNEEYLKEWAQTLLP